MKLGEFFVSIGAKGDATGLNSFKSGLDSLFNSSLKTKMEIAGIAAAISLTTQESIRGAVEYSNFALQTGLSARQMKIWQYAAEQNNVSGQDLVQTIKSIQKAQAEILMGGGNARPFYLLGVNVREQDTFKVLERVRSATANMPPAIASQIMGQMGIGQNFLNIFRSQAFELGKVNKELILSEKEYAKLLELNRTLKDLTFTLSSTISRIVIALKPALEGTLEIYKHISMGAQDAFRYTGRLIEQFPILKTALVAIGAVAMVAFAPITAAFLALFLILDDIYVYLKGGDSIIGRIEKFFKKIDFLPNWMKDFKPLFTSLKDIVSGELVQALEGAKVLGEVVFKIISYWLDRASVLLGFFVNVIEKVMEFTNTKAKGGLSFKEYRTMEKSPELQMAYNKGRDAHGAVNTSDVDTFRKSTEYLKYTKEQKEYFEKALNYTAPFEKMINEFTNTKAKGGLSFKECRTMEKSPELQMAYNKGKDAHGAVNTSDVDTFRKSTEYLKYTKEQKEYFEKALNYTAPFEKMINEVSDIILGGVIKLPSLLSNIPVSTEKSDNIIKSSQNEKMINEVSDIILGGIIKLPSLLSNAPVSTEKSDNIIKSSQNNLIGGKNDINSQIASVKGHSITNNFTIHEANNPQVTANLVEKVFQRQINNTYTQIPTQNMGFARP